MAGNQTQAEGARAAICPQPARCLFVQSKNSQDSNVVGSNAMARQLMRVRTVGVMVYAAGWPSPLSSSLLRRCSSSSSKLPGNGYSFNGKAHKNPTQATTKFAAKTQ